MAEQFNLTGSIRGGYVHYHTIWKNFSSNECKDIKEIYGEFEDYKKFELVDENEAENSDEFVSKNEIDDNFSLVDTNEIEYVTTKSKRRIDSPKFREQTISAYKQCAITGETFMGILEACHIEPYRNKKSNHIQNSLLLRIDIHELFDSGYITIDENYKVKVSPQLESEYYRTLDGKKIHLPSDPLYYPSVKALLYNKSIFKEENTKNAQLIIQ